MAKLVQQPTVNVEVRLVINEAEARALDALAGYGTEPFLKTFYEHMGKHYLQPHENGLRSLFDAVREHVGPILDRLDKARKAFTPA